MTPRTEAGKRLLSDYPARYGGALYTDPISRQLTIEAIAAIEAEARRAALTALREKVEGLHRPGRSDINFRAVLAEIDRMLAE